MSLTRLDESSFWKESESIMFQATKGLFAPGWSLDDLLNEARVGIWEAYRSWDPEGGRNWHMYAIMIARRRVMDLVTYSLRKKNEGLRHFTDIEVSHAYDIPEFKDVSNDKQIVANLLKQIKLTKIEQDVIGLKLLDYTPTEIATELGVAYRSVDNAYQRVIFKLKRLSNPDT